MNISKRIRSSGNQELWDLYTCKDEYNPMLLDKHQRYPYYVSKNRDVLDPKVSRFLKENGTKLDLPDRKKFALVLTHDIDKINVGIMEILTKSLKSFSKFQIKNALGLLTTRFPNESNAHYNFKEIMDIEEKYVGKSTFYFQTCGKNNIANHPDYSIEELISELRYIIDKGWEVGLHGSYFSHLNFEKINEEKNKLENLLGKEVKGFRSHFLRFKTPETWEMLEKAGFEYDTSFGYSDMIGFRNGMCHPFRPYNLNVGKEINIVEIPLNIMDCSLFDYMRLDHKSAWFIVKHMIDTTKNLNGVITLLWHNTYMNGNNLKFYEKILKYCSELDGWITSAEKINDWCKKSYLKD